MAPIKLVRWIILTVLLVGTLLAGQMPPLAALPAAAAPAGPDGNPESIAGSYVHFPW